MKRINYWDNWRRWDPGNRGLICPFPGAEKMIINDVMRECQRIFGQIVLKHGASQGGTCYQHQSQPTFFLYLLLVIEKKQTKNMSMSRLARKKPSDSPSNTRQARRKPSDSPANTRQAQRKPSDSPANTRQARRKPSDSGAANSRQAQRKPSDSAAISNQARRKLATVLLPTTDNLGESLASVLPTADKLGKSLASVLPTAKSCSRQARRKNSESSAANS